MTGLLYIISPSADHKTINALLLHIRDWEYVGDDPFTLITTSNTNGLEPLRNLPPTSPPLLNLTTNTWATRSLQDVEAFHLTLNDSQMYIALDDEGIDTKTCILRHQATVRDPTTHAYVRTQQFQKIRVPWDELYMTWCNLEVANMDFQDFVKGRDEPGGIRGGGEDGCWFEYANYAGGQDLSDVNLERRDAELERLRALGLV
jgi:hypothetical protein